MADDDNNRDEGFTEEQLKKVLEDLIKVIKQSAKVEKDVIEARKKKNIEQIREQGRIVEQHIEHRRAMKLFDDQLNFVTQSMTGGMGVVGALLGITRQADDLADSFNIMIVAQEDLRRAVAEWEAELAKKNAGQPNNANSAEEDVQKAKERFQKSNQPFEGNERLKKIAENSAKAKGFFKKHALGIVLGASAFAGILMVLKKAFDASPMFQQMIKLLKFGFMLVLRPIGDFFGFLLRPIVIMLLRRFILPFYQKYLPLMIQMGNDIGEILTKWKTPWDNLESNMTFTPRDDDPLFGTDGAITKWARELDDFDWEQWNTSITDGLGNLFPNVPSAFGENFDSNLQGLKDSWDSILNQFSIMGSNSKNWIKNKWDDLLGWFNSIAADVDLGGTAQKAWNRFTTLMTAIFDSIVSVLISIPSKIWSKITGLADTVGSIFGGIITALLNAVESVLPWVLKDGFKMWRADIGMAKGGTITEPIMGIGRSGKTYSFGENGSETVTPNGQGGAQVVINIQNMSGDRNDVERLRRVILEVLQSSSSNRVRV